MTELYRRPSDADRVSALAALQSNAKTGDQVCVNNLGWYLAITEGVKPEDLTQAGEMMEKLVADHPSQSQLLDTLAAVKAAEGDYAAAASDEQKAIDALPADANADGFRKEAAARIALYKSGRPYVAPPANSTTAPVSATAPTPGAATKTP
jgi:hypothetical protein